MDVIPNNGYIIKGQVIIKALCIIVFHLCCNNISSESVSKASELTMNKHGELVGREETVELHYKIPDLWNIL